MDYGQAFGGAVNILLKQAILMKKNGHAVTVCFSSRYGDDLLSAYRTMCVENGILLLQLPYTISSYTEGINTVSIIENYDLIKNLILYFKPDILHSVQINATVELVARELKIPHIMNIHQALPAFFSIQYMDIFPKYLICDSFYFAKVWEKELNLNSTCMRGVAVDSCLKDNVVKRNTKYVCVGAVSNRKNQLEVIRAFHFLISSGHKATLDIYGYDSGLYARNCKEYVESNGLNEVITFHGYCDNMPSVYVDSDAVIIGSLPVGESYPNVVSEALAHSVVVISTPVAGVPEVIKDSYNGYLADGYAGEDIYKKLLQFERDKEAGVCDTLIKNANNAYFAEHTGTVVYKKLLDYYDFVQKNTSETELPLPRISDLSEKFNDIIKVYKNALSHFTKKDSAASMLWYFWHVSSIIKNLPSDSKFYIWGAGNFGLEAKENLEVFFPFISIEGFLDSKKEGVFEGYNIYKPESVVSNENAVIFISAVGGQWDIIDILEKNGKICNKTYFFLVRRAW